MSIFKTIGIGMAWNTAGTLLGKAVVFFNVFVILSRLSPYEYGLTELSLSVVAAAGIVLLPGLVSSIIADLGVERARGNFGKVKALFLEFFPLMVALGFLGWAVLFFGSSVAAHYTGNDLIGSYIKIVSFLLITSPFRTLTLSLASVFVRFKDQALYSVTEELAKSFLLVFFFYIVGLHAEGLLYAAVGAQIVAIVIFLPRTLSALREFIHVAEYEHLPFWRVFREHRKWSMGASYIGSLGQSARLWIIKLLLGTEAVGLFAFAYGLYSNMSGLLPLSTILPSLIPQYAHRTVELVKLLLASMRVQLAIAVLGVLGGLVVGPPFVRFFFPQYLPALPLFMVMVFAILPAAIIGVLTPVFYALKEQQSLVFSNILKLVASLILLPLFILPFGLMGIALEIILVLLINVAERYRRLRKMVPEFTFTLQQFTTMSPEERTFARMLYRRLVPFGKKE